MNTCIQGGLILSILLPAYNVALYLEACVESIFSQYQIGVEVIVLDDCSTDETLSVAQQLAQRYSCLKIIKSPRNLGLSEARNTLFRYAGGEYIWFVDSDDMIVSGALRGIFYEINSSKPDLIIFDFQTLEELRVGRKKIKRRRSHTGSSTLDAGSPGIVLSDALLVDKLYAWNKVFKKAIALQISFPMGQFFEDINYTARLIAYSTRTVYKKQVWVTYRRREQSILSTLDEKKLTDWRKAMISLRATFDLLHPLEQVHALTALSYCLAKNYLDIIKRSREIDVRDLSIVELVEEMKDIVPLSFGSVIAKLIAGGHAIYAYKLWRGKCLAGV